MSCRWVWLPTPEASWVRQSHPMNLGPLVKSQSSNINRYMTPRGRLGFGRQAPRRSLPSLQSLERSESSSLLLFANWIRGILSHLNRPSANTAHDKMRELAAADLQTRRRRVALLLGDWPTDRQTCSTHVLSRSISSCPLLNPHSTPTVTGRAVSCLSGRFGDRSFLSILVNRRDLALCAFGWLPRACDGVLSVRSFLHPP